MEFFYHIFLLTLCSYIIWKVCDSFQKASLFLGQKMPLGTRGATINAMGSSFPEFLTSFIAIFEYSHNNGAMFGIANTTGTVIFNITLIPFFVILACYFFKNLDRMKFKKYILLRDGFFLIFIQAFLMFVLSKGKFSLTDSVILVVIYILYLLIIFKFSKHKKALPENNLFEINQSHKNIFQIIKDIDLYKIFFKNSKSQTYFNSTIILFISILIFYFTCEILVSSSYALGEILHIPSYLVAMTITAIATSIPDAVLSIKDAKINEFDEAITNAFGSNIFNISFCIAFPIMIYNLIYSTSIILTTDSLKTINNLKNISIFLVFLVVFIFISKGKRWLLKGFLLFFIYIGFLFYIAKEAKYFNNLNKVKSMQHHHH